MTTVPVGNFHNARLSVAQAAVRELVTKIPGVPQSGLVAEHPIQQAATASLGKVYDGTISTFEELRREYLAQRQAQKAAAGPGAPPPSSLNLPEECADLLVQYVWASIWGEKGWMAEIESEFKDNECDPGWLTAAVAWVEYYWDGKAPQYVGYTSIDQYIYSLPSPADGTTLRVGVLGDWGTGEPEAAAVLDQLMQQSPDLLLHVGDIYYAGTQDEVQSNFLSLIAQARQSYKPIPVYNLPGNHDYYSGGQAFYAALPNLNLGIPGASVQQASYFCLRNDSWQLQGMDTGYYDSDLLHVADDITHLQETEVAWHQDKIANAGGRSIILFSHHQLYSAFERIGAPNAFPGQPNYNPYLYDSFEGALSGGQISLWLWGHEHLLEVYSPYKGTIGRCIGNSAFPVFNNEGAYTVQTQFEVPVLEVNPSPQFPQGIIQTGDDGLIYQHGFALLELSATSGTVSYYEVSFDSEGTATSTLLYQESIPMQAQAGSGS